MSRIEQVDEIMTYFDVSSSFGIDGASPFTVEEIALKDVLNFLKSEMLENIEPF